MTTKTLDSGAYYNMLAAGSAQLGANRKTINDLNVFPIPDGDTGDNMFMTIDSGCKAASDALGATLGDVASAASKGMLLGARGNSGVILSRIFAGMAHGLEGKETAGPDEFAIAMNYAVQEAYNAVSNPVEGTILTVLKDSVAKASGRSYEHFNAYFSVLLEEMQAALGRTPDLLPVLKEAGVVDSGGAGLLCIARGMAEALDGKVVSIAGDINPAGKAPVNLDAFTADSVLEFGYCTEFLLRLQTCKVDLASFDEAVIKDYLNSVGDSVVCFRDGSIVKVHVHTTRPGDILNHCQTWGEYLTIKVENMTLQHEETIRDKQAEASAAAEKEFRKERRPLAVVTVTSGEGLASALTEAGADWVIEGGQTMNPSAADFIEAFDKLDAQTVLVFPNNSNIILTAQQAAELYDKSRIEVIPTRNFGAGYVAIASVDHACKDVDAIVEAANEAIATVTTGLVSKAVRDTERDGIEVHEGDYIGFCNGAVLADNPERKAVVMQLCQALDVASHDVALVFSGNEVDEAEAEAVVSELSRSYRRTEIILSAGNQPVFDYIIVLC